MVHVEHPTWTKTTVLGVPLGGRPLKAVDQPLVEKADRRQTFLDGLAMFVSAALIADVPASAKATAPTRAGENVDTMVSLEKFRHTRAEPIPGNPASKVHATPKETGVQFNFLLRPPTPGRSVLSLEGVAPSTRAREYVLSGGPPFAQKTFTDPSGVT